MLLLRVSLWDGMKSLSPQKAYGGKGSYATIKIKQSVSHIKESSQPILPGISKMHKRRVHLQWTRCAIRNTALLPFVWRASARLCFCMISIPRAIVGFIKGISSVHPCSFIPFISLQCSPFRRLSTAVGPRSLSRHLRQTHTHMEWATERLVRNGEAETRDRERRLYAIAFSICK